MQEKRNVAAYKLAIRQYWKHTAHNWRSAIPAFVLPGVGSILVVYVPTLVVAKLLNIYQQNPGATLSDLAPYIFLLVFLWVVGEVIWRFANYALTILETHVTEELYVDSLKTLLKKDTAFFNDNFAGSLTKKLTGYVRRYVEIMDTLVFNVITSVIPLFFVMFIFWRYSPWLVVILLVMLILNFMLILPRIKYRHQLVAAREEASNVATGHVADVISNAHSVKAFAREEHEMKLHTRHVFDFTTKLRRSWDYQNWKIDTIIAPFYILTNSVGLILAILLHKEGFAISTVFVTFSYYTTTTAALWNFNRIYRNIESGLADAAQFTELLLDEPAVTDMQKPESFKVRLGVIDIKNVTFRYKDGGSQHLFKNLDLSIDAGEKVALVGHSGGGKSTITRLLLRLMDIDSGQILIDGQDIAMAKQSDLRKAIAYVPQDPAMFHRSLADNIRYGRLDATDQEIRKIAKAAHAAEFIDKLESGYETMVGERGIKLSGGQRQRIAIARAMLKDAPILVLDEATSSLDSDSELLIQDALWKLMEGRTAIVIAHRLSTIQRMDRIVVLEDGEIVEQGSHIDLLKKNGVYAKLWAHQSGGFLED